MIKVFFTGVFLIFLVSPLFSEEVLPTLTTYEGLVSRLVDLRCQLAKEKETWKEQSAWLLQEKELLLKEKEMLEDEIASAKEEEISAKIDRAELLERKEGLRKSLDN